MPRQWTLRAFSPAELDDRVPVGDAGPWHARFVAPPRRGVWLLRPAGEMGYHGLLPGSGNDGPVWFGRGLTASLSVGAAARFGPVSIQVAPIAWWTENQPFEAVPSPRPFADYAAPNNIDLPQRLAGSALGRVDPGESTVRLDLLGVAMGLTSAGEWWGPSLAGAAIMGHEAAGVPRVFLGTTRPTSIWIGRVHGRIFAGREVASAFGADTAPRRLGLGAVGTFTPRGAPWLEIGGTRYFHRRWRDGGPTLGDVSALWEGFLKVGLPDKDQLQFTSAADNQLASLFARVAIPGGGTEVYAEFAREDHAEDVLDLINEPDHISGVTLGFQTVVVRDAVRWLVVRGELQNGRVTHLGRTGRGQGLLYEHSMIRDGHTFRGQLLGSRFIRGGSGGELSVDRLSAAGRLSLRWERIGLATGAEGGLGFGALHTLEVSGLRFRGQRDVGWRLGVTQRIGRDPMLDATSVMAGLQWRGL